MATMLFQKSSLVQSRTSGGGGGIRTHESLRTHAFQACALDRYATPPIDSKAHKSYQKTHKTERERLSVLAGDLFMLYCDCRNFTKPEEKKREDRMPSFLIYSTHNEEKLPVNVRTLLQDNFEIFDGPEELDEVELRQFSLALIYSETSCLQLFEQLERKINKSKLDLPIIAIASDEPKDIKRLLRKRIALYQQIPSVDRYARFAREFNKVLGQSSYRLSSKAVIIGESSPIKDILKLVDIAASTDGNVMIIGETGSGKSLVAEAIHQKSKVRKGPFVEVNCGAIPKELIEAELFGSMRGSYTGSVETRLGYFERANNGTIFLDEIGATSNNFQVRLLKVLETGRFHAVGAQSPKFSNARVICATNRNLKDALKENEFRIDLLYRLYGIEINIPPLRERREDIRLLIKFYLKKQGRGLSVTEDALKVVEKYHWPGNIRELFAVLKFAGLLAKSEGRQKISTEDIRFPHFSL